MQTAMDLVHEFNQKHNVEYASDLDVSHDAILSMKLIREEFKELYEAVKWNDGVESIAKEMADLIYVLVRAALVQRIPLPEVFAEVHASNMTKEPGHNRPDGKITKGPNYRPPDLKRVLGL